MFFNYFASSNSRRLFSQVFDSVAALNLRKHYVLLLVYLCLVKLILAKKLGGALVSGNLRLLSLIISAVTVILIMFDKVFYYDINRIFLKLYIVFLFFIVNFHPYLHIQGKV